MFADGVMAIAITLLVLEIRVPQVEAGHSLAKALADQWPSYVAYVTSFLTIGIVWVNHHRMFKLISRSNHTFLMINIAFLMVIAFMPFPTALVANYVRQRHEVRTAALVYGGTMILLALMFNAVWSYASMGHRLLVEGVDPESIRRGTASYRKGPVIYAAITLIALVNPYVSLALFVVLAGYWLLPSSGPG
jgi:uncharacterized membrane protein